MKRIFFIRLSGVNFGQFTIADDVINRGGFAFALGRFNISYNPRSQQNITPPCLWHAVIRCAKNLFLKEYSFCSKNSRKSTAPLSCGFFLPREHSLSTQTRGDNDEQSAKNHAISFVFYVLYLFRRFFISCNYAPILARTTTNKK